MDTKQTNQNEYEQQLQIKLQYWNKWIQWCNAVKKQRFTAIKILRFQNLLEERTIHKVFYQWKQIHQQQQFQQVLKLKNSIHHQDNQQQQQQTPQQTNDDNLYKMTLAIKFHQRKTYTKSIRAWIGYRICCKKFQHNLSKIYIKFLIKKYFDIINQFKIKSKNKKLKKAQTSFNSSPRKQEQIQNAQSQFNFVKPNIYDNNQNNKFPNTNPNFKELLNKNSAFEKNQQQKNMQLNTFYNFQRNPIMGESRRSDFSTLSAQLEYQSKRKFRPITELPSIPDLQNVSRRLNQLQSGTIIKNDKRSPVKIYQSQSQQQTKQHHLGIDSLSESRLTQCKNQQNSLKSKILELLIKQKLLTLSLMNSEEFNDGMEYKNYRQKTVNYLNKIKDIQIK